MAPGVGGIGLSLALLAVSCKRGEALSTYNALLPNGGVVPCPPTVDSSTCSAAPSGRLLCPGVGHATCRGGSMPNNPFGRDFAAAGHLWSVSLCNRDSDGDGLTNGEELGDPCCLWKQGDLADSSYAVSHPGFASSVSSSPVRASTCASIGSPTGGSTSPSSAPRFFNAGEVERNVTVANPGVPLVPGSTTNYWTYTFPLPTDQTYHITGFSVLLDNVPLVHHFLVAGCKVPVRAGGLKGPMQTTMPDECGTSGIDGTVWVWAPGSGFYATPSNAGIRFGRNTSVVGIAVEVHYSALDGFPPNTTDFSTFIIYYTPTLRQYDMGMIVTGSVIGVTPIPPGVPAQYDTTLCAVSGVQPNAIVTNYFLHAHLLGRRIWTDKIQRAPTGEYLKVADMGRDDMWTFDNQYLIPAPPSTTIQNGDFLSTTCVYDSTGVNRTTRGGFATTDEMCMQFTYIYPYTGTEVCNSLAHVSGRLQSQNVTSSIDLLDQPTSADTSRNLTVVGTLAVTSVDCPAAALVINSRNPCLSGSGFDYVLDSAGNLAMVPVFTAPSTTCGPWVGAVDRSSITQTQRRMNFVVGFTTTPNLYSDDTNITTPCDGLTITAMNISFATILGSHCLIQMAASSPAPGRVVKAGTMTPLTGTGGGALSTSCNAVSSPCDAAGYVYLQSSTTDTAYGFAMTRADPMLGCASMLVARPARSTTAKVVAVLQPLFPAATAVVTGTDASTQPTVGLTLGQPDGLPSSHFLPSITAAKPAATTAAAGIPTSNYSSTSSSCNSEFSFTRFPAAVAVSPCAGQPAMASSPTSPSPSSGAVGRTGAQGRTVALASALPLLVIATAFGAAYSQ